MDYESPLNRRLLKRWAATIVIWVFVMGAGWVASKAAWKLDPDWCVDYMLVKYMLFMEDSSCSSAAIEPPSITGGRPSSRASKSLSVTLTQTAPPL